MIHRRIKSWGAGSSDITSLPRGAARRGGLGPAALLGGAGLRLLGRALERVRDFVRLVFGMLRIHIVGFLAKIDHNKSVGSLNGTPARCRAAQGAGQGTKLDGTVTGLW